MCYKCFYGLLFIIFVILLYLFVPFENWANWITAIATCCMAYFAGKALNTWRTEEVLKQKSIQYRNLLEILIKIKAILLEIEGTKTINNTQRIYSVFEYLFLPVLYFSLHL